MHRRQILEQIRSARAAHFAWQADAQAQIESIAANPPLAPINLATYRLGPWYADARSTLGSLPAFRALERQLGALDDISHRLANLGRADDNALIRHLGLSLRWRGDRRAEAHRALADLQKASDTLIHALDDLEREVNAITEIEFIALEPG